MYIVHVNAIEIRIHDSDDNYYLDGESPFSSDCSHIMKTGPRKRGGGVVGSNSKAGNIRITTHHAMIRNVKISLHE